MGERLRHLWQGLEGGTGEERLKGLLFVEDVWVEMSGGVNHCCVGVIYGRESVETSSWEWKIVEEEEMEEKTIRVSRNWKNGSIERESVCVCQSSEGREGGEEGRRKQTHESEESERKYENERFQK